MTAKVLMVQGTSSSVGKSIMVAALCRIYSRRGLRVAPFKSQNMALNSFVTLQGHEIGRAQAVQASAAGVAPSVLMNPILLKPQSETGCQVVIMGRVDRCMSAADYHTYKPKVRAVIAEALRKLRNTFDLVIIEGAGSPVEMNLKDNDVANMFVAELCDAPVLLVADIDRGGIFASLVGTMALLEGSERERVRGFLINKFRGDPALLGNGLEFLEKKTGVPVLGVIPYLRELGIADEDSVALGNRAKHFEGRAGAVKVAVVHVPHISNYDDLLPLERESHLEVAFVRDAASITEADLVVLPGSKCTAIDLLWLRELGLDTALIAYAKTGKPLLGICGGCQMLGMSVEDPSALESNHPSVAGLGLMPFSTHFAAKKTTAQVVAKATDAILCGEHERLEGYEIHMGQLVWASEPKPAFHILRRGDEDVAYPDGCLREDGAVFGTMIHGIFHNATFRKTLMIRIGAVPSGDDNFHERELGRLADTVETQVDMNRLDAIVGLPRSR